MCLGIVIGFFLGVALMVWLAGTRTKWNERGGNGDKRY